MEQLQLYRLLVHVEEKQEIMKPNEEKNDDPNFVTSSIIFNARLHEILDQICNNEMVEETKTDDEMPLLEELD